MGVSTVLDDLLFFVFEDHASDFLNEASLIGHTVLTLGEDVDVNTA